MISKLHINHPHDSTKVITAKMCCQTTFEQKITSIVLVPGLGVAVVSVQKCMKNIFGGDFEVQ